MFGCRCRQLTVRTTKALVTNGVVIMPTAYIEVEPVGSVRFMGLFLT